MRCFALDLTATETSAFTGLSVRFVNAIFLRIRQRLAEACERESPLTGTLEADESYFGPHRIRGKRDRGAGGKTIVFGLLKRGNQVQGNRPQCEQGSSPGGEPGQGRSGKPHSHRRDRVVMELGQKTSGQVQRNLPEDVLVAFEGNGISLQPSDGDLYKTLLKLLRENPLRN